MREKRNDEGRECEDYFRKRWQGFHGERSLSSSSSCCYSLSAYFRVARLLCFVFAVEYLERINVFIGFSVLLPNCSRLPGFRPFLFSLSLLLSCQWSCVMRVVNGAAAMVLYTFILITKPMSPRGTSTDLACRHEVGSREISSRTQPNHMRKAKTDHIWTPQLCRKSCVCCCFSIMRTIRFV
jgi:hypothetical protein